MKGYRGYVASRAVNGSIIPQRVQNLVIRSYAEEGGLTFLLSATEYYMDECFMVLNTVLEELEGVDGIIAYSLFMLPSNRTRRREIVEAVLADGKSLHFAVEKLVVKSQADLAALEDVFLAADLAAGVVPAEGLGA